VTATYSNFTTPSGPTLIDVLINGVSVQKETGFDSEKQPMWVYWAPDELLNQIQVEPSTLSCQGILAERYGMSQYADILREPAKGIIPVGSPTLEFIFLGRGNPFSGNASKINGKKHMNTLNAKPFQKDKAGVWICRLITGASQFPSGSTINQPLIWKSSVLCQRSPNGRGWVDTQLFRDSRTGHIPANIGTPPNETLGMGNVTKRGPVGGNGFGLFDEIVFSDWTEMGLPDISEW
jgi:hypothetical protein